MGSQEGASWEKPPHRVEIGEFWIGKQPVSNGEFRAFQPGHHSPSDDGDQAPVTGLSWQAAQDYFRWLSEETGKAYRFPPKLNGKKQPVEAWRARNTPGAMNRRSLKTSCKTQASARPRGPTATA